MDAIGIQARTGPREEQKKSSIHTCLSLQQGQPANGWSGRIFNQRSMEGEFNG